MVRKRGSVNHLKMGLCPQCNQPALLKTVKSRCESCKAENKRQYHKEYMRNNYYNKEE